MASRAPIPFPVEGSDSRVEAKLELNEFLLACDDPIECANRGVEWLAEHCGVTRGMCLLVQGVPGRLVGVAGCGSAPARISEFALDLEERGHPLVLAMSDPGVVHFAAERGEAQKRSSTTHGTPFGAAPFL